jgi:phosphonopyruvate decarboxylase
MINPKSFYETILNHSDFITGVPDSLLKDFNACLLNEHPEEKHIIAPNEGTAIALAIGNYIATKSVPTVYMQNSGLGNAINPLLSLADKDVYGIPIIVIIGWRGEPNVKDEPQHFKQGMVQEDLLKAMQLDYVVIDSSSQDYQEILANIYNSAISDKSPKVVLVRKGTFESYPLKININIKLESRESAINTIIEAFGHESIYIGTTGKLSRELFELRVKRGESHQNDFLTVGGMGHALSIATGVSMNTSKQVICLDGDGALLMHMGGLVSAAKYTSSFIHIVLNNRVHDSVGGQPTLINNVKIQELALACGYKNAYFVNSQSEFNEVCNTSKLTPGPTLIEYLVSPGSRKDLGRPTQTPVENLKKLMKELLDE